MAPVFISEYTKERFVAAVMSGTPIRQAGNMVGLSRSTSDRLWQSLRPVEAHKRGQIWSTDQSNELCAIIASGGSYVDAAAVLPFTRRQCQDRYKTLHRRKGVLAEKFEPVRSYDRTLGGVSSI